MNNMSLLEPVPRSTFIDLKHISMLIVYMESMLTLIYAVYLPLLPDILEEVV